MRRWLVVSAFLLGCAEPPSYEISYRITCSPSVERADKIIACVAAANPKSDEEPEDWLRICNEMMRDALCPRSFWVREVERKGFLEGRRWGDYIPCDSASKPMREACERSGWTMRKNPEGL